LIIRINCNIKAVKNERIAEKTKKIANVVVAIAAVFTKGWRRNRERSTHHKGSGYLLAAFSSRKLVLG
jgi:hypothetical protein